MSLRTRVAGGLRSLFRSRQADRDLDAELREFLESAIDAKMAAGLSREAATRAARIDLGSIEAVKDRVRDVGWESIADSLWQDVRYALRTLRKSPGFTAVTVLTLALGIGANTAIFSLVDALMLRMLPVRQPEGLVMPVSQYPGEPDDEGFSWSVFEGFRDQNRVFSDLFAVSPTRFQVMGEGLEEEPVEGAYAIGTMFPTLGVQPAIGRLFGPRDDQTAGANAAVAVVSWEYWKRRFNLDPAILGRRLVLNGTPVTMIGVVERGFSGLQVGEKTDLWVPVAMDTTRRQPSRRLSDQFGFNLMGRLKSGVSIEQARADMAVLNQSRVAELALMSGDRKWLQAKLDVKPAGGGFPTLRQVYGQPLLALMGLVGLLLLIACTNIASMLLARGAARQREMAVRVALGASRWRVARQVLTESLLLAAAGSLLGALVAYVGAGALVRIITSGRMVGLPRGIDFQVQPDARVLLFTVAIAALAGVLFGMAPAWNAFASVPASSLREIGGAGETRSRRLFGKALVVVQVALSVVLLSAAGLFVSHLSNLRNVNLGFQRDSVLLVTLDPSGSGYKPDRLTSLYREMLGRLQAIPGVRSATLSAVTPVEGAGASRFAHVDGSPENPEERRRLAMNSIGPKYFATLGTPWIAGRDFQFEDASRPRVAIVNQAMARHYFGDGSPLGKHVTFDGDDKPYEIVGVAADAKYLNLYEAPPRMVYTNAFQEGRIASTFALRTSTAPSAITGDVRRAVRDVLKTVRVAKVTTMDDQVNASIIPERLIATLSGFFGGLGALLAAIGLYGLLAYSVARRTSEIGVRMALGATEGAVTRMVLTSALGLACAGLIVGTPIAIWSRHFAAPVIENPWVEIARRDSHLTVDAALPIAFAAVTMIAVALVAAYVPARRAARVDPIAALRSDGN
ncbi:MAG TPA: ABC transporter permease [Vicinamibacterales bacterium]